MPRLETLSVLLVLAVVAAVAVACASDIEAGSTSTGIRIPAHWQDTRHVDGHRTHVIQEKVACRECHQLNDNDIGGVNPQSCASCHEQQASIEHNRQQAVTRFGPEAHADCTTCHAFTLDHSSAQGQTGAGEPYAPRDCGRCHLSAQGELSAVTVHSTEPCLTCHKPHEQHTPTPASCDTCHHEVHSWHAGGHETLTQSCTDCHSQQHAQASLAAERCLACHQEQEPLVPASALFENGHSECVGCHVPHSDGANAGISVNCQSCHEHVQVLGGKAIKAHNQCSNCHAPHDVKSASARACSGCHQQIQPNHPKHGEAGSCTGCHDPHPASSKALSKVRNCTSCHQEANAETVRHQGVSCRECHTPHNFILSQKNTSLCARCHAENTQYATSLAGHAVCGDCHRGLPHRPEALLLSCDSCHQKQHGEAVSGHQACQNCHEPHSGNRLKDCRNCHQSEHRTAPKGHQACQNCHQPHTGSTASTPCASCHAEQQHTPHGKIAANCGDCHRPHGPEGVSKPPACSSCHQRSALAGLHSTRQHSRCGDCHQPHGEKQALRDRCLDCHKQKSDHFPDAPNCASCHLFVSAR